MARCEVWEEGRLRKSVNSRVESENEGDPLEGIGVRHNP